MSSQANHTGRNILVVEDNLDNQQLVTWILEDYDYTVSCAGSAEEGIALMEAEHFDLVLMDISLPGMDGKEATRKIRSSPQLRAIPVIALTAHAVQGERDSIIASGVDSLVTKPVDETELLELIAALLKT